MNRVKICIFSVVTASHGIEGGMEIHGRQLAEGLSHRKHEVTFISTQHPGGIERAVKNGVEYYYLRKTVFGSMRKGWVRQSIDFFNRLNTERQFDVILCQQAVVPGIEKQSGVKDHIPVIVMLHGNEWRMLVSQVRQVFSHKTGYRHVPKYLLSFAYFTLRHELPQYRWPQPVFHRPSPQ